MDEQERVKRDNFCLLLGWLHGSLLTEAQMETCLLLLRDNELVRESFEWLYSQFSVLEARLAL